MSILDVRCPQCRNAVPAADVNVVTMLAKCSFCEVVFTIDSPAVSATNSSAISTDTETAPSRPGGITEEEGSMGERIIRRRWFHAFMIGLLFFCIAWDGFLVFWYWLALSGKGNQGPFEWFAVLFPIGHVAIGLAMTYYVMAGLLNSTKIILDMDTLRIRHSPIPWWGNYRLGREEIKAIELEFGPVSSGRTGLSKTISVHHLDDRKVILMTGLPSQQAEYIAWHLANTMKVPLNRRDIFEMGSMPIPAWLERFLPRQ
ncbi:MAG: hypothetical protein ACK58L_04925 [Planctomycetota bacterium]